MKIRLLRFYIYIYINSDNLIWKIYIYKLLMIILIFYDKFHIKISILIYMKEYIMVIIFYKKSLMKFIEFYIR